MPIEQKAGHHRRNQEVADDGGQVTTLTRPSIKVADEVWLAVAMLHQRRAESVDFSIEEIMEFAKTANELRFLGPLRPGFYVHVVQHCVANRPPSPARYRMILETTRGRRRLFRPGDPSHPGRVGGKSVPKAFDDLPENWFNGILEWYRRWSQENKQDRIKNDPLLALYGSGRDIWADEHADEYIRRLREGWE
jgi:hypothetical protein